MGTLDGNVFAINATQAGKYRKCASLQDAQIYALHSHPKSGWLVVGTDGGLHVARREGRCDDTGGDWSLLSAGIFQSARFVEFDKQKYLVATSSQVGLKVWRYEEVDRAWMPIASYGDVKSEAFAVSVDGRLLFADGDDLAERPLSPEHQIKMACELLAQVESIGDQMPDACRRGEN